MKRRVLEICLLTYPRARRRTDREYLRDLALDLADDGGFARQAASLVRSGLSERSAGWGRRVRSRNARWTTRAVLVCAALTALTFSAVSAIGPAIGTGEPAEVEELACASESRSGSKMAGCENVRRLTTSRMRDGWTCETELRTHPGERVLTSRCTRG